MQLECNLIDWEFFKLARLHQPHPDRDLCVETKDNEEISEGKISRYRLTQKTGSGASLTSASRDRDVEPNMSKYYNQLGSFYEELMQHFI
jgi:hypothetical protein